MCSQASAYSFCTLGRKSLTVNPPTILISQIRLWRCLVEGSEDVEATGRGEDVRATGASEDVEALGDDVGLSHRPRLRGCESDLKCKKTVHISK